MWQLIIENLPIYIPTIALFVRFYQLNTTRKNTLKNERFAQYQDLLRKINYGLESGLSNPIASIHFLKEYPEYAEISIKVFRDAGLMSGFQGPDGEKIENVFKEV